MVAPHLFFGVYCGSNLNLRNIRRVKAIKQRTLLTRHGLVLLLIAVVVLTACGRSALTDTSTLSAPTPAAIVPSSTSTPALAGSAENPLSLLLVSQDPPSGASLAQALSEAGEVSITLNFAESYAEALDALCTDQADVVSLNAFGYLVAQERGCGEATYILEQNGDITTQGQVLVNVLQGGLSLEGTRGQAFCRESRSSLSGWVIPSITLRTRGLDPFSDLGEVIDAGDDETVVHMLYAGECAFAATALDAEEAIDDLEYPGRIALVEELTPVPNDVLVVSARLDEQSRAITLDLLRQHRGVLAEALGADGLLQVPEGAFFDLEALLGEAGVDPVTMGQ